MRKLFKFLQKVEERAEDTVTTVEEAAEQVAETSSRIYQAFEKGTAIGARKLASRARHFLQAGSAGGIVLIFATVVALIVANTDLNELYHYLLNEVRFSIGFSHPGTFDLELRKSVLHWINDGMMAVFFFLIGLEIKREVLAGELSSRQRALLPTMAAIGGMAVPAGLFWYINRDIPANLDGWAIPAATDIAFALGILAFLRHRVPPSLKILLTAIAVIDDLGAIVIIAAFYSHEILFIPLYFATAALVGLILLSQRKVNALTPYLLLGFVLWVSVLESGIHATLAGVITAFFIPLQTKNGTKMLNDLLHNIEPWVIFGILPIFAFANAGVALAGLSFEDLSHPITFGIFAGLFFGKQIGVFLLLWLAIITGMSPKPKGADWLQLYAVAVLCGVGFTMSLFIGELAYSGQDQQVYVRLGVLLASLSAAVLGYLILRFAPAGKVHEKVTVGGEALEEG